MSTQNAALSLAANRRQNGRNILRNART